MVFNRKMTMRDTNSGIRKMLAVLEDKELELLFDEEMGVSYVAKDPYAAKSPDIIQCLSYWDSLRGDRLAPAWHDFNWLKFPVEIIPYCGVIDIKRDPLDFIYRFWGTAHATTMSQEMTGKSVRDMMPESEGKSVYNQYLETLKSEKPRLFVNTICTNTLGTELTEVSLRLPFSDSGEQIDHILAFSDMRQDLKDFETAFYEAMSRKSHG